MPKNDMLNLYNTASRQVEKIIPLQSGRIGMYCCGPTVYQRAHIGNLRTYIMEDVLRRTLEAIEGFEVRHIVNITDVGHLVGDGDDGEDKMEKGSREGGKTAWEIAKEYEALFKEDIRSLNIETPTAMPRATDHIAEQIELVKTLEERGVTYGTSDGIYFDTSKAPHYGRLSGQKLEDKQEGARVEANAEKRNPSDFALWKFSDPNSPKRQMEWESPWGIGFPGWHIECSAMSRKELGQPFDIHCGGVDHIPVHHENEIAQSETAYGMPYVKYWMHVEFLTVDGQKMSKSIGNTYTLEDLKKKGIDPRVLRLYFLGAHYQSKQNFTWEALEGVKSAFEKLERAVRALKTENDDGESSLFEAELKTAMENDLNTPSALAVIWRALDSDESPAKKVRFFLLADQILGLGLADVVGKIEEAPENVRAIAEERARARFEKRWEDADKLRAELSALGWTMLDDKEGYRLEKE